MLILNKPLDPIPTHENAQIWQDSKIRWLPGLKKCRLNLQHITTALLSEGVGFLGAEPNEKAVLLLMVVDELDDVLGSLRHKHPLEGCFAP